MRSVRSVSHSVSHAFYVQDYCKSNQPMSLKLDVMIGSTNRKNWLIFGGDPVPDTDAGSLFHFPHHCRTGDFRRLISKDKLHMQTLREQGHGEKAIISSYPDKG